MSKRVLTKQMPIEKMVDPDAGQTWLKKSGLTQFDNEEWGPIVTQFRIKILDYICECSRIFDGLKKEDIDRWYYPESKISDEEWDKVATDSEKKALAQVVNGVASLTSTHWALKIFNAMKVKERNVTFRIPKSMMKDLRKIKIDPRIAFKKWHKKYFHIANALTFEFEGECDVSLVLNDDKYENVGYKITNDLFDKVFDASFDHMLMMAESEKKKSFSAAIRGEKFESGIDLKALINLPVRMDVFREWCKDYLKYFFHSNMWYHCNLKTNSKKYDKIPKGACLAFMCDKPEELRDFLKGDISEEGYGRILVKSEEEAQIYAGEPKDKLAIALAFLLFSHKQEFIKRMPLAKNQKRMAKGLPPKGPKDPYPQLVGEKIIELPRQFTEWVKAPRGGGKHASPIGHVVEAHPRTFRHSRFTNMRGKTITVRRYEVNGGNPNDLRKTVLIPRKNSKAVKKFVKDNTQ